MIPYLLGALTGFVVAFVIIWRRPTTYTPTPGFKVPPPVKNQSEPPPPKHPHGTEVTFTPGLWPYRPGTDIVNDTPVTAAPSGSPITPIRFVPTRTIEPGDLARLSEALAARHINTQHFEPTTDDRIRQIVGSTVVDCFLVMDGTITIDQYEANPLGPH